jgi:hypothetical protein
VVEALDLRRREALLLPIRRAPPRGPRRTRGPPPRPPWPKLEEGRTRDGDPAKGEKSSSAPTRDNVDLEQLDIASGPNL